MKKSNIKLDIVTKLGISGNFNVTSDLLNKMDRLINPKAVKQSRGTRRLDAMSLLKFKRLNGVAAKDISEGFIYIVSNPAWAKCYKVGYTLDVFDRLSQYQVGSPFGDYKLEGYYFCSDVRTVEKHLHSKLQQFHIRGEWFSLDLNNLKKFIQRQDTVNI